MSNFYATFCINNLSLFFPCQQYYEMYEREKERYEREMKVYKPKQEPTAEVNTSAVVNPADESVSVKEELDI